MPEPALRDQSTLIPPRILSNPWVVLLVLTLGFFMILLDTTIVNIAIPAIEKSLNAGFDQILWVLNAYILVYAVLLITAGRLGDMFGPKRLFMAGLVIFTVSSAACGLSQSPNQLIVFRVIQGVGGATLTPQTLSVITTIFPPARRGAAFGVWGAVAGVAAAVGPTLGGFLVTNYSWRAIFYVNVPIGCVAVTAAFLLMPEIRSARSHRLDLTGVMLASTGLFVGVFALIEGQRYNWGPLVDFGAFSIGSTRWGLLSIYSLLVYALVLLAIFTIIEIRATEPLLPLQLFKDRNFAVANVTSAIVAFAMLGTFVPLTIFLQSALGFSAVHAGLTVVPMSLVSMGTAPLAGRLTDRVNGKYVLMFGLVCFACGLGLLVHALSLSDSSWSLTFPLAVSGLGMGCTFAPMITLAMRDVEPRLAGAASGFINTIRQVGGAVGSSVVGAVLANQVAGQFPVQAAALAGRIPGPYRSRFLASWRAASHGSQQFGPGQSGGAQALPGTSSAVAAQISAVYHEVFARSFLNGVRPSQLVAVVALGVGALVVALMRGNRQPREAQAGESAGAREAAHQPIP